MARGGTAARRYAEAAFEVAMRDDTLERWRADLDMAASLAGDPRAIDVLANPAMSPADCHVPAACRFFANTWPVSSTYAAVQLPLD